MGRRDKSQAGEPVVKAALPLRYAGTKNREDMYGGMRAENAAAEHYSIKTDGIEMRAHDEGKRRRPREVKQ